MNDYEPEEKVPVKKSHWRTAIVIATLIGAGAYVFGRLVAMDDAGRVPPMVMILIMSLGPILCVLGFAAWWALLGDGRWYRRLLGEAGCLVGLVAAVMAADPSIRQFTGTWGIPLSIGITGVALALMPRPSWGLGAAIWLLAMSPWWLLRQEGVTGSFELDAYYRWTPTVRELADAQVSGRSTTTAKDPSALGLSVDDRWYFARQFDRAKAGESPVSLARAVSASVEDWPGFRGAERTGIVSPEALHGWTGGKPKELWRRNAGVAWSSFCVVGNALFTQEQRGASESVVCYRADTGDEVWARGETSEHTDGMSGTGPRATPSYANGSIYATTATGTVVCLRAETGEPVWRVSLEERFKAVKPMYGVSPSPLVVNDMVIVNPGSDPAPKLVALDAATGATRWTAEGLGTDGYSSPHLANVQGVAQVLIFNGSGLSGLDVANGKELWHYEWKVSKVEPTTIQPLVLPDGRVVIGGGNIGMGLRCVSIRKEGDGWSVAEAWKTTKLTPTFNDIVRRGDYIYGLDKGVLSCVNLANGERVWKDGRYDNGQILLVGDKLLIVSEKGQLACVMAKPDDYEELWKMDVLKGKTWNHPAIARGRLFVRKPGEIVAFELPAGK